MLYTVLSVGGCSADEGCPDVYTHIIQQRKLTLLHQHQAERDSRGSRNAWTPAI